MKRRSTAAAPEPAPSRINWANLRILVSIAIVSTVATSLADAAAVIDFGAMAPLITAGLGILIGQLREFVSAQRDRLNSTGDECPYDDPPEPRRRRKPMPEKQTRGRSRRGSADLIVIAAICAVLSGAVYVAKRFVPTDAPAPIVVDPVAPIVPADDVPSVAVDPFDREQVSLAFARNRQLFAQVCLETARRGAAGEFKTEADESAFAEPLWQRASKEAFSLLAEAQDRRHGDKWDPTESARQHLEWAAVADPRSIRPAPPDPTNKRRRPLQ